MIDCAVRPLAVPNVPKSPKLAFVEQFGDFGMIGTWTPDIDPVSIATPTDHFGDFGTFGTAAQTHGPAPQ